jgi:hypothetical protein
MPQGIISGHDTEFFVVARDGKPIPAHKAGFPDKKHAIKKVLPVTDWITDPEGSVTEDRMQYAFYRDGYAVEVNSKPASCRGHVWNYLAEGVQAAAKRLGEKDLSLSALPYMDIDVSELASDPMTPEDVKVFGCTPTFNAYNTEGGESEIEVSALRVPFRTIAAHLHISANPRIWPELQEVCESGPGAAAPIIKLADFFIGLPATWFQLGSPEEKLEYKRRRLYGKAGEFRIHWHPALSGASLVDPKGIRKTVPQTNPLPALEYRVLSSHMVRHSSLMNFAWGMFRDVVLPVWFQEVGDFLTPSFESDVQRAINTGKGLETLMDEWFRLMKELSDQEISAGGFPVFADIRKGAKGGDYPSKEEFLSYRDWTQKLPYTIGERCYRIEGHTGVCHMIHLLKQSQEQSSSPGLILRESLTTVQCVVTHHPRSTSRTLCSPSGR